MVTARAAPQRLIGVARQIILSPGLCENPPALRKPDSELASPMLEADGDDMGLPAEAGRYVEATGYLLDRTRELGMQKVVRNYVDATGFQLDEDGVLSWPTLEIGPWVDLTIEEEEEERVTSAPGHEVQEADRVEGSRLEAEQLLRSAQEAVRQQMKESNVVYAVSVTDERATAAEGGSSFELQAPLAPVEAPSTLLPPPQGSEELTLRQFPSTGQFHLMAARELVADPEWAQGIIAHTKPPPMAEARRFVAEQAGLGKIVALRLRLLGSKEDGDAVDVSPLADPVALRLANWKFLKVQPGAAVDHHPRHSHSQTYASDDLVPVAPSGLGLGWFGSHRHNVAASLAAAARQFVEGRALQGLGQFAALAQQFLVSEGAEVAMDEQVSPARAKGLLYAVHVTADSDALAAVGPHFEAFRERTEVEDLSLWQFPGGKFHLMTARELVADPDWGPAMNQVGRVAQAAEVRRFVDQEAASKGGLRKAGSAAADLVTLGLHLLSNGDAVVSPLNGDRPRAANWKFLQARPGAADPGWGLLGGHFLITKTFQARAKTLASLRLLFPDLDAAASEQQTLPPAVAKGRTIQEVHGANKDFMMPSSKPERPRIFRSRF